MVKLDCHVLHVGHVLCLDTAVLRHHYAVVKDQQVREM